MTAFWPGNARGLGPPRDYGDPGAMPECAADPVRHRVVRPASWGIQRGPGCWSCWAQREHAVAEVGIEPANLSQQLAVQMHGRLDRPGDCLVDRAGGAGDGRQKQVRVLPGHLGHRGCPVLEYGGQGGRGLACGPFLRQLSHAAVRVAHRPPSAVRSNPRRPGPRERPGREHVAVELGLPTMEAGVHYARPEQDRHA